MLHTKLLVVVESSYLLKNFISSIKIDLQDFNKIEFLATNGSIFKYRNEKKDLKYQTLNQNIENKIRYFNGTVIIATDQDQNGHLIALECASIRNDSMRFQLNIDDVFKESRNGKNINIKYFIENSNKQFNLNNSIEFLAQKMKEEIETKEFYMKYGVKLSIDDRILLKLLKSNINHILNKPEWLINLKKGNKDIYLYLASSIELDKDIEDIYNKSLEEYEEGNLSYLRTDGNSHNFIERIDFLNNIDLNEILDYILKLDINKIDKNEYQFFTENIFLLAKLYNVGTPSTIFYIYKNVMNNSNLEIEDDIDIYRRINSTNLIKNDINIDIENFSMDKMLKIINKILNNTDDELNVEENIKKDIDIYFNQNF